MQLCGVRPNQDFGVFCPVLPQHPKRSIAMLPLHPPMSGMSGMAGQVPGMPGLVGSAGPWNASMAAGRPIFAPAGMGMVSFSFPHPFSFRSPSPFVLSRESTLDSALSFYLGRATARRN